MTLSVFEAIPKRILTKIGTLDLNIQSENCNREINSLLGRTVLIGGKRLRPLLTYLMGDFFQVPMEKVTPLARAIEMVHAASLSHDDVVDGATTRREIPSINIVSSNKRAVLAGDYLLADVIVELTNIGNLPIVSSMAQVISRLSEGEWLQLDASESRRYSREIIEKIALCKTSSVMEFCILAPAHMAKCSDSIIDYCKSFGENLGIAFQLVDDTLDFSGDSKKDHFLDVKNGIINSVLFEWLESSPEIKRKFEEGQSIESLLDNADLGDAISKVRQNALEKLNECRVILDILVKEVSGDELVKKRAQKQILAILDYLAKRQF